MRRVLFIHNGTSGRFRFLAEALRRRGWTGALLNAAGGSDLPGFETVRIPAARFQKPDDPLYAVTNKALAAGRLVAQVADKLRAGGFRPDLIVGHSGWGEMLFLREVFPDAPQIQLAEYYYRSRGADVGFDPELDRPSLERDIKLHANNAFLNLSLSEADRIVTPTRFQADLFPSALRSRIRVIHEGIDTGKTRRRPDATVDVAGKTLRAGQPVVTFINRYFEPMRGFHSFMRALPRLLKGHQDVQVLLIGSKEQKGYGPKLKNGNWHDKLMAEVGPALDPARVHFLGPVDYETLTSCLSISSAHVYFTYPFVLSWSLLDAMACECLIVGSDTAPVREVIRHGRNGLLTDFFDHAALADLLLDAVSRPETYAPLRQAARETVLEDYDRARVCDPAWLSLVDELVPGQGREPSASGLRAA
jgi:glycosyltransferase involved in cell wall biosynthesis